MPARDNGSEGYGEFVVLWQHITAPQALWRTKIDGLLAHDNEWIALKKASNGHIIPHYRAGNFRAAYRVIEINGE